MTEINDRAALRLPRLTVWDVQEWPVLPSKEGVNIFLQVLFAARARGLRPRVSSLGSNLEFEQWRQIHAPEDEPEPTHELVYHEAPPPIDPTQDWIAVVEGEDSYRRVLDFADRVHGHGLILGLPGADVPLPRYLAESCSSAALSFSQAIAFCRRARQSAWSDRSLALAPGSRALLDAIDPFLERMIIRERDATRLFEQFRAACERPATSANRTNEEAARVVSVAPTDVVGDITPERVAAEPVAPRIEPAGCGPAVEPWWAARVIKAGTTDTGGLAVQERLQVERRKLSSLTALARRAKTLGPEETRAASSVARQTVNFWFRHLAESGIALANGCASAVELAQRFSDVNAQRFSDRAALKVAAARWGVTAATFERVFDRPGAAWMITLVRLAVAAQRTDLLDLVAADRRVTMREPPLRVVGAVGGRR